MGSVEFNTCLCGDPRVAAVVQDDPAAMSLYVMAATWTSKWGSKWFVPSVMAMALVADREAGPRYASVLVRHGLWVEVDGGYAFDDLNGNFRYVTVRQRIPLAVRQRVYERDLHRCVECGSDVDLSLDHVRPWSRGGSDHESNLQTLCRPCNSRKGARV